ncbi:MAG: thiamine pyrophosphate-dependent dehydrogenase E1 component subunit alpha [Candidatus Hodarchaeota archaeon]
MDNLDIWQLYEMMLHSRLYEELVAQLWEEGKIFGEMHLGIGEEAIMAGVLSQLESGDAVACSHRGTSAFLLKGVDPIPLMLEFLGHPGGLCKGMGGHMHLFSKEHLIASTGIVGAGGPAAAGFALSFQYKKTKNIAVAIFGEGACNQGMLLESMNLASAWNLPVLFICCINDWAITTRSCDVTGGNLVERARGFGIDGVEVDGLDVEAVWNAANSAIKKVRKKSKPFFLLAKCVHMEGHFLGDPLLQFHKTPMKSFGEVGGPLFKSLFSTKGARIDKRMGGMAKVLSLIGKSRAQMKKGTDPLKITLDKLKGEEEKQEEIKNKVVDELEIMMNKVLEITQGGDGE